MRPDDTRLDWIIALITSLTFLRVYRVCSQWVGPGRNMNERKTEMRTKGKSTQQKNLRQIKKLLFKHEISYSWANLQQQKGRWQVLTCWYWKLKETCGMSHPDSSGANAWKANHLFFDFDEDTSFVNFGPEGIIKMNKLIYFSFVGQVGKALQWTNE